MYTHVIKQDAAFPAGKRKPPFGGFPETEDARVGLLVACVRPLFRQPASRSRRGGQARICSCIGLPGIAPPIVSEFLGNVPIAIRSAVASVIAAGSASCIHRPQYWQRLGPLFAGRLPPECLLAMRLSPHNRIYARFQERKTISPVPFFCCGTVLIRLDTFRAYFK